MSLHTTSKLTQPPLSLQTDINLANTLINEFPCRPHWTKNTREVFALAKKNIDPGHLSRFSAVRQKFDPEGIFKSPVGEALGFYA